ncbi:type I-C CRISPR-associated protein Cas8c/Csd1 [Ruminococcaceae bacterium OttesenSCG-928-L11]|nr:type I-C CRISPR-associated protein Cas8c/Csd1 [Ruminococcaceae bacterium OttesenSCG-928-L11]
MQQLYQTYEANHMRIGRIYENEPVLLPVGHTTQIAHINLVLNLAGEHVPGRSSLIEGFASKASRGETIIIPCTEKSGARTSGLEPHPLFDNLQYLAGDFLAYGGKEKRWGYSDYMENLKAWCASPHATPAVRAVYRYLERGCLIADLIRDGVLYVDEAGAFPDEWEDNGAEKPAIFAYSPSQFKAFVRFEVLGAPCERLWQDVALRQCWIDYLGAQTGQEEGWCYATGARQTLSVSSPKKIRNAGDGAKLISSNDSDGFTFRGRFETPGEAYQVGRDTTEKAHSALRWLIARQGWQNGSQVVVTWMPTQEQPPCELVLQDSLDLSMGLSSVAGPPSVGELFADHLGKALSGYAATLDNADRMITMGVDSATPGRLSMFYYRDLPAKELIQRVASWHRSCTWLLRYRNDPRADPKAKPRRFPFVGAPSPRDIAQAAYGRNADDKLMRQTIERILPCILDGARFPTDIMRSAATRATAAVALEDWEARKTLDIACALVRKCYNEQEAAKERLYTESSDKAKEVWPVELDPNTNDRSYRFGQALAYARRIEELAQWKAGAQARQTNAERMQVMFSQHPAHTWKTLSERLLPYLGRFRDQGRFRYEEELNAVLCAIRPEDFNDQPLSPLYLLGYASQLNAFYSKPDDDNTTAEDGGEAL